MVRNLKTCYKCKELKPLTEFYKRAKANDGLTSRCRTCSWQITLSSRKKNRQKYNKGIAEWKKRNREKVAASLRSWRVRNMDIVRKHRAKWRNENREKFNAISAAWKRKNPLKVASYMSSRKKINKMATPKWANKFFMEEAYDLAKRRSELQSGGHAKWHVDHIVPLRSELVCGLHVENNLRVVPAQYNLSKGNRHWPDMPTEV